MMVDVARIGPDELTAVGERPLREAAAGVPASVRTLADAEPGRTVRIQAVLMEAIRSPCARVGIRVGTGVTCRDQSREGILAEAEDGHPVLLAWPVARLIQVERVEGRSRAPGPALADVGSVP